MVQPSHLTNGEIVPERGNGFLKLSGMVSSIPKIRICAALSRWGLSSLTGGAGHVRNEVYTELHSS